MLYRIVEFPSIDRNRHALLTRERLNMLNLMKLYLPVGYSGYGLSCRDDAVESMNLPNLHTSASAGEAIIARQENCLFIELANICILVYFPLLEFAYVFIT